MRRIKIELRWSECLGQTWSNPFGLKKKLDLLNPLHPTTFPPLGSCYNGCSGKLRHWICMSWPSRTLDLQGPSSRQSLLLRLLSFGCRWNASILAPDRKMDAPWKNIIIRFHTQLYQRHFLFRFLLVFRSHSLVLIMFDPGTLQGTQTMRNSLCFSGSLWSVVTVVRPTALWPSFRIRMEADHWSPLQWGYRMVSRKFCWWWLWWLSALNLTFKGKSLNSWNLHSNPSSMSDAPINISFTLDTIFWMHSVTQSNQPSSLLFCFVFGLGEIPSTIFNYTVRSKYYKIRTYLRTYILFLGPILRFKFFHQPLQTLLSN